MDEFALIEQYFDWYSSQPNVEVGLGDDAAIVQLGNEARVALSTDTFVEGVHFPAGFNPEHLGWRLAATNLSDQAAMGASPRFATLNLTLQSVDEDWLAAFSVGLRSGLECYDCVLVGGDTTAGPLTLSLQIVGEVNNAPLKRGGASAGDRVFVSGTLGDAAGALAEFNQSGEFNSGSDLYPRFSMPTPRVALGKALCGVASAAIDISDGLIADLEHLASASGVGIEIAIPRLPLSAALLQKFSSSRAQELAATGGDDYELAFTAAAHHEQTVFDIANDNGVGVTMIGRVVAGSGVISTDAAGDPAAFARSGHRHF